MASSVHLWRRFRTGLRRRWAAEVIEDEDAEDGYRILDHDPSVADPMFLHRLALHMAQPHPVQHHQPLEGEDGGHVDRVTLAHSGDEGHFQEAIRTLAGAFVSVPPVASGSV